MSVLLLGIDYRPLRVIPVRRAVGLLLAGRADLVEVDPAGRVLRSARAEVPVPAVVRLTRAIRAPFHRRVPLTRRTLTVRDHGDCQVAGCDRAGRTIDHIVPRSRGGSHEWRNVALMCERHNQAKADRLLSELGWNLKAAPYEPRAVILLVAPSGVEAPEVWAPYLA